MSDSDSRISGAMQAVGVESGRATTSASKNQGDQEQGYSELYKLNQIWYRTPPQLSIVSKRTILQNMAQRVNYTQPTSDVITFIFNSGEYYVNMSTSYLYLELGFKAGANAGQAGDWDGIMAYISQGNICSMFDEIVFTSASGTEINREQNKGLYAATTFRYCKDQQYMDTYGQAQGAPLGSYSSIYDACGPTADNIISPGLMAGNILPKGGPAMAYCKKGLHNLNIQPIAAGGGVSNASRAQGYPSFIIPMDQILGFFKPYMNVLVPAGALAGGRLELRLKSPTEWIQSCASLIAGVAGGLPAGQGVNMANFIANIQNSLIINKIYICFDAFQLNDAVLKRLVQIASGPDGLTMMFDTFDFTPTPSTTTGVVEAQVTQARSRIVWSICVLRDDAVVNNPYVNSLAAEAAMARVCQSVQANQTATNGVLESNVLANGFLQIRSTSSAQPPTANFLTGGTVELIHDQCPLPADTMENGQTVFNQQIVNSYQCQLGSLFFPQQPLSTIKEFYNNALYVMGKSQADSKDNCSVSYEDFCGGRGFGYAQNSAANYAPVIPIFAATIVFPYGCAIYGMLAEKSSILGLSGLPIANARLLRHKFVIGLPTKSGANRTINVFTKFTRVCKVFLGGRVVIRE